MNTDFSIQSQALPLHALHLDPKPSMEDGAKALEAQFAYFMLKTMDQSSSEGGLFGEKNQGLGHFKDVFFMNMAEKMVENREIGFQHAIVNTYQKNSLLRESGRD